MTIQEIICFLQEIADQREGDLHFSYDATGDISKEYAWHVALSSESGNINAYGNTLENALNKIYKLISQFSGK